MAAKPDTASQYAYKTLKAKILQGVLPAGTRLKANELKIELGISHIPVREALQLLWAEGLIVYAPHRMAIVADFTEQMRDEMMLVRALLEIPAVGVAAATISPDALARMKAVQREIREAHRRDDIVRYIELNDAFHRTLYAAVGVAQVEKVLATLQEGTSSYRHRWLADPQKRAVAIRDHDEMLSGLERGDSVAVRTIAFRHLARRWDAVSATATGTNDAWMESLRGPWMQLLRALCAAPLAAEPPVPPRPSLRSASARKRTTKGTAAVKRR